MKVCLKAGGKRSFPRRTHGRLSLHSWFRGFFLSIFFVSSEKFSAGSLSASALSRLSLSLSQAQSARSPARPPPSCSPVHFSLFFPRAVLPCSPSSFFHLDLSTYTQTAFFAHLGFVYLSPLSFSSLLKLLFSLRFLQLSSRRSTEPQKGALFAFSLFHSIQPLEQTKLPFYRRTLSAPSSSELSGSK